MTSLSQPLQAVVALFEGPLAGVRFADVDASGLGKLAAEAQAAAAEVEAQEAKLASLRQNLAKQQEALLVLAHQGLAYARVYAEGDDALLATLNEISLPRAAKPRKAKSQQESEAPQNAAPSEPMQAEAPAILAEGEEPEGEPAAEAAAKTKPSYARPKLKRRLGKAAPHSDSL